MIDWSKMGRSCYFLNIGYRLTHACRAILASTCDVLCRVFQPEQVAARVNAGMLIEPFVKPRRSGRGYKKVGPKGQERTQSSVKVIDWQSLTRIMHPTTEALGQRGCVKPSPVRACRCARRTGSQEPTAPAQPVAGILGLQAGEDVKQIPNVATGFDRDPRSVRGVCGVVR